MGHQRLHLMETPVRNNFKRIVCSAVSSLLLLVSFQNAYAQTSTGQSLCASPGFAFLYFNGVNTTPGEADKNLERLRLLYATSPSGEKVRFEKLYNYSNGFEDFAETFSQRVEAEEGLLSDRYELFLPTMRGSNSVLSLISNAVNGSAAILDSLRSLFSAKLISQVTSLFANPPTQWNYTEHRGRLDTLMLEGQKIVLFAHSQGNLFANVAYTYALTKVTADSIKVVHVAPASPVTHGDYVLADLDLVINGLRLTGTVKDITDHIPGYALRPAGINGLTDVFGHGLIEIYVNESMPSLTGGNSLATNVRNYVNAAMTSLVAPPRLAKAGFFSATLTWDGPGDVDLHVYEPDNSHIYFAHRAGTTGYLDVDNMISFGPEHYYASCDAASLQVGTYRVAVANYSRAEGRTASVQIATTADGVIGTSKPFVLGVSTGTTPSPTLVTVLVSKDAQTGKYSATIGQ